ncbi:hypothetical protein SDRG_06619 [Saprolegnia diclina VS20]|uniref:Anaphase-promoting complex subunit 4 WD40 domain-containing protein n=1 Tax=Saprolegnia diclina (strain VS20) TaxID=1156394 RepID=T0QDA0_SAPDV|nr:hypothetical protein SDRG_06619 [Saprolegnia diclina VS20]EQC35869.1 hypothetical protein SDRG_06619 [Saprolegnia diclina VS20]|eukprot:XP_008610631.1 hypothetical protein SDRG_06619 [Saprolegnia diclina VS20]
MDKRRLPAGAAAAKKKPKPSREAARPITAFFQRVAPPLPPPTVIEDIDSDSSMELTPTEPVPGVLPLLEVGTLPLQEVGAVEGTDEVHPRLIQSRLADGFEKQAEGPRKPRVRRPPSAFQMLVQRERQGAMKRVELQRLLRSTLATYATLPMGLRPDIRPQQWISTMAFDADGVILATGSSDGTIALYDFDEYFYHLLQHRNASAKTQRDVASVTDGAPAYVPPVHVISTSFELKRLRWNPKNQDEIACSFASRNEIHLFNLKKLPRQPYRILRTNSRPSSGYYDLLYTVLGNQVHVIGGDNEGAVRMWDINIPAKPKWQIALPREYGAVNALVLCEDNQHLVVGTEHGYLTVYDIFNLITPAFAQRSVPKRRSVIALHVLVRALLVQDSLLSANALGVVSMQRVPHTSATVVCQLHNDWVVVLDALEGRILKLHTVLRELSLNPIPRDPTVQHASFSSDALLTAENRSLGHLRLHRCSGSFVFDGAAFVTGLADDDNLYVLDMHTHSYGERLLTLPSVPTLQRFRIPTKVVVTAVAAHPASNVVVCGMESNDLIVVGAS